jgi:hypothetical protein
MANKVRLTTANIKDFANKMVSILRGAEAPVSKAQLSEDLGLTIGQLSTVIKYMRRCSLEDLERYIAYYPISSRKGYSLPKNFRDFLPCYYTLYCWSESLKKTIEPMKIKMDKEGIDVLDYALSVKDDYEFHENYLRDLDEMNKTTSWFLEQEEK